MNGIVFGSTGHADMKKIDSYATGGLAGGFPVEVMMPRATCGTEMIWMQIACATNNATATFFVGVHEYAG